MTFQAWQSVPGQNKGKAEMFSYSLSRQIAVFMLAQVVEFSSAGCATCICGEGMKKMSVDACDVFTYASKWHRSSHEFRVAILGGQVLFVGEWTVSEHCATKLWRHILQSHICVRLPTSLRLVESNSSVHSVPVSELIVLLYIVGSRCSRALPGEP